MPENFAPKYKMRFILNDYDVTYKMIIIHPMETGNRLNKQTSERYPANYLESVSWFLDGELIMRFLIGPHVSKNPYFSFKMPIVSDGSNFSIETIDNKNQIDVFNTSVSYYIQPPA